MLPLRASYAPLTLHTKPYHELHVARARRLGAGCADLDGQVRWAMGVFLVCNIDTIEYLYFNKLTVTCVLIFVTLFSFVLIFLTEILNI